MLEQQHAARRWRLTARSIAPVAINALSAALDGPADAAHIREVVAGAVARLLDTAEATFAGAVAELGLRARILRKERAVGVISGGDAAKTAKPDGHGSDKIRTECLDELVRFARAAWRSTVCERSVLANATS